MARLMFKNNAKRLPWLGKLGWRMEAWCLELFWFWVKGSGPEQASLKGYRLLRSLGPRLGKNNQILNNLKLAFPGMQASRYQSLAAKVWGNTGAVVAEYPFLKELVDSGPASHTEIEISSSARPFIEAKKPAVYVAPHVANWEIAAATLARLSIPITSIYSPISNPYIDSKIQSIREALGMKFVPKQNAIRQLARALREGRSVGMLPDQRYDQGEAVPYFGIDAPTAVTPAWLAIKMNCPLIPVEIERIGPARFRAIFHDPIDTFIDDEDFRKRLLKTTRQVNALFEQWICKRPGHWYCLKRRWSVEAFSRIQSAAQASERSPVNTVADVERDNYRSQYIQQ